MQSPLNSHADFDRNAVQILQIIVYFIYAYDYTIITLRLLNMYMQKSPIRTDLF